MGTNDKPINVNVINLSDRMLTDDMIKVLKKGLGFCPSNIVNNEQLKIDLYKFIRELKLMKHFSTHFTSTNHDSRMIH